MLLLPLLLCLQLFAAQRQPSLEVSGLAAPESDQLLWWVLVALVNQTVQAVQVSVQAVSPRAALWALVLVLQAELAQAVQVVQASMQAVSPQAARWVLLVLDDLQDELVHVDQVEVTLQDPEDELVLVQAHVSEAVSPQAALQVLVLADLQDELVQVDQDLEDELDLVQAQVSEAVPPQAALVLLQDEHEAQVSPETALQVPVDPALLPSGFHHAACAAITSPSRVQFGSPAWPKPHQRSHHHRCHLVSQLVQLTP